MIPMMLVMAFPVIGLLLFFLTPWTVAVPIYLVGVFVSAFYHHAMMSSMKLPVRTGAKGMAGRVATVTESSPGRMKVRCGSEIWAARSEDDLRLGTGTRVEVVEIAGLSLVVRPCRIEDKRDEESAKRR
jgi:membrane protein implicated in regulation of membrane protease activity